MINLEMSSSSAGVDQVASQIRTSMPKLPDAKLKEEKPKDTTDSIDLSKVSFKVSALTSVDNILK